MPGPAVRFRRLLRNATMMFFLTAAAHATEHEAGLWFTLNLATPLSEDLDLSLALQPRFDEDIGRFERLVIRPSLDFKLAPGTRLAQGYDAHLIEQPGQRTEHRLWQQVQQSVTLGSRLRGLLRLRLEQRFIEHVSGVALRGRLLVGGVYPLGGPWGLRATNEVFVNLNQPHGTSDKAFDQNRLIVATTRRFSAAASGLLGYQMQIFDRQPRDRIIHQLFIGWSQRF